MNNTATIQFKGKIQEMLNVDGSVAYRYIRVPEFDRKHCNMQAFRTHAKYGSYANSDLFVMVLRRIRTELFGSSAKLKLDAIPAIVSVNEDGFLAQVTIAV